MKLMLLALLVAAAAALPQQLDEGPRRYRYIPPKYEDYEDPEAPLFSQPSPPGPTNNPSPSPSPTAPLPDPGEVDPLPPQEPIDELTTPEPAPFPSPDQNIGQGQDGGQGQDFGGGDQGQGPQQTWPGGNSGVTLPPEPEPIPNPIPNPEPVPKPGYGNPWYRPGQFGNFGYNKQPCSRFGCLPGFGTQQQAAHPFGYWGHANSYSSAGNPSHAAPAAPYYPQWDERFSRKYLPPRF